MGQLQRGRSCLGGLGLLPLPRGREPRDGDAITNAGIPGLPCRLSSLNVTPVLTKKRVELVPWSTAPTNGPKTAFFAAAMKPASGLREVATGFPGDGGQRRSHRTQTGGQGGV